jgi:hypothetical protein
MNLNKLSEELGLLKDGVATVRIYASPAVRGRRTLVDRRAGELCSPDQVLSRL